VQPEKKLQQELTSTSLLSAWRNNVVEPYTKSQLTKPSDRFAALSAIANRWSKSYRTSIWLEFGELICKEEDFFGIAQT